MCSIYKFPQKLNDHITIAMYSYKSEDDLTKMHVVAELPSGISVTT